MDRCNVLKAVGAAIVCQICFRRRTRVVREVLFDVRCFVRDCIYNDCPPYRLAAWSVWTSRSTAADVQSAANKRTNALTVGRFAAVHAPLAVHRSPSTVAPAASRLAVLGECRKRGGDLIV